MRRRGESADGSLSGVGSHFDSVFAQFPSKLSPRLHYDVEYFSTTGVFSRWVIAQHPFRQAVHYGNRLFARRTRPDFPINLSPLSGAESESFHPSPFYLDSVHARLLSWTSGVLLEDIDVVGSAWIHLQMFVKSCTDIAVFVYLEAVDVNGGFAHYVTEGKVSTQKGEQRRKRDRADEDMKNEWAKREKEITRLTAYGFEGSLVLGGVCSHTTSVLCLASGARFYTYSNIGIYIHKYL